MASKRGKGGGGKGVEEKKVGHHRRGVTRAKRRPGVRSLVVGGDSQQ